MGKVIFGALLLVAGIVTLVIDDVPVIWTGGMIVGVILMANGAMEMSREKKVSEELSQFDSKWEEFLQRLQNDEPIDDIAEQFYKSDNIPPIRTIQVAAHFIKGLSESSDEDGKALAVYLASKQIVDSNIDPKEAIDEFSFLNDVYFVDDTVTIFSEEPKESIGTEGTIVLNKGFLFFFEKKQNPLDNPGLGRAIGKLEDAFPMLSIATSGYALVSGLSDELSDYFDGSRKQNLKKRFDYEKSLALPLVEIGQIGPADRKGMILTTRYLEVSGGTDDGNWKYWFGTTNSDEEEWANSWMERLQLACIADGELLV